MTFQLCKKLFHTVKYLILLVSQLFYTKDSELRTMLNGFWFLPCICIELINSCVELIVWIHMETGQKRCLKNLFHFFQEGKRQKEEEEQEKHIKQYLYHIALITHYKLALQCFFYAFCKCGWESLWYYWTSASLRLNTS